MSAHSAVLQGRVAAEANMADTCIITRESGEVGVLDPATGLQPDTPPATVYTGKCRVQTYEAQEARPSSGQHVYTVQRHRVDIPVGVAEVRVDDQVTISSATLDPELTGRTYRVTGLLHKTFATANRLLVEEIAR